MYQFQIDFWNGFKKIFCYNTGLRFFYEKKVNVWRRYDRLTSIPINNLIKKEGIKTLIIDLDGTLKHYKKGLTEENKKWINKIKNNIEIYIISNANNDLTSKVANELGVPYICKAKKPSPDGFNKICELTNSNKDEVIVIGDAARADVLGANRAGINKVILLDDLNIIGLENGKNEYDVFYYKLFYFILFSFLGWTIEMIYHLGKGVIENRGFLYGPFCIIYGFGVLLIFMLHKKIKINNPIIKGIVLWLSVFFVCTVFEYLTSYFTELILGIRLWDYTGYSFNIGGRVRLITSVAWANCSIVLVYLIKPLLDKIFKDKIENKKIIRGGMHIILDIMCIDYIISFIRYLIK